LIALHRLKVNAFLSLDSVRQYCHYLYLSDTMTTHCEIPLGLMIN